MATRSADFFRRAPVLAAVVLGLLAGSCTTATSVTTGPSPSTSSGSPSTTTAASTTTTRSSVPVPTYIDGNGFNDHTVPAINSIDEFFALSRGGFSGQSVVKFSISEMAANPRISWMDSNFYSLHDEWFWFRLLNGAAVAGSSEIPSTGLRFGTVAAIYEWAKGLDSKLPHGLTWVGSQSVGTRLYSDAFYDLALKARPRVFGLGSLVYFPDSPNGGGERWVIELEYHDAASPEDIATYFETIASTVPQAIGDRLEWVIRSTEQEQLAQTMAAGELPFHDRIVRYSALVAPGEVAVYNPGIAAGRLLIIGEGGKELSDARDDDILLIENVPDWLPPGRALISSSPQTPLAHVNLLARNRGIPNASQSGILADAGIRQAARVRAPAIVRAVGPDQLEVVLITESQYQAWLDANVLTPVSVQQADLDGVPNVIDLGSIPGIDSEDELAVWRTVVGGKATGFLNLMAPGTVTMPGQSLAITVKPYREHMAQLTLALDTMLADPVFKAQTRIRFLMLEGPSAYAAFYTQSADRQYAEDYATANPAGTVIGDLIRAGGFREYLRSVAMSSTTLNDITESLTETYRDHALSQGLRFRSSSTVEDIEGFNGAGLYESNSGFLRPDLQVDEGDRSKSVEKAIKATWSSYWSFEAFEERRRERIDHSSGAMAILVHARFDDNLEESNSVLTFTIHPEREADSFSMILNAQEGAVSVANPDPSLAAVPEEVRAVRQLGDSPIRIERVAESNLVPAGTQVLDDTQLRLIFEQAQAVALVWRNRINAALEQSQHIQTLTLDFEVKEMAAGWPAVRGGVAPYPARIVLKQARSLEPGLRSVPSVVRDLAIPRDILSRARLVQRVFCPAQGEGAVVTVEVLTDVLLEPDVGHSEDPFVLVETDGTPAARAECNRHILYSTADQLLLEFLETGLLLNLSR